MAAADVVTKSVVIRTRDGQRIKLRCPICGDETWAQGQGIEGVEGFQPILVANSTNKGMLSMPVTQLACGNCGHATQFVSLENVSIEIVQDD
jgi:hypothetical protein